MTLRTFISLTAVAFAGLPAAADAAPVVKGPSAVRVTEGKAVNVRMTLAKPAARRTAVWWSVAKTDDFVRTHGNLVVRKGRRKATLRLVTRQDVVAEGTEAFVLKLAQRKVKVTLVDDDAAATAVPLPPAPPAPPVPPAPPAPPAEAVLPTLSIADLKRGEGPGDTQKPKIVMSEPRATDVTVQYTTVDGTAKGGADFSKTSGVATFKPGMTEVMLPIGIAGDQTDEDDESFKVTLASPLGATLADAEGTVTILDDDPKPVVSIADAPSRLENATTMAFEVKLDRPSVHTITLKVSTVTGTATGGAACGGGSGADFVTLAGHTVTFAPGQTSQTVSVAICEDTVTESDETFTLGGFQPSETVTPGDVAGTGVIEDDAD